MNRVRGLRLSTTARMPALSAPSAIEGRGFVQRGEQHRREEIDGSDDEAPGLVGRAQRLAHESEPVALRDLVLHLDRQHRGAVEEHDAPHLRRGRGVEERERAEPQPVDRIVAARAAAMTASHRSRSTSSYTAANRSSFDAKWW